MFTSIFAVIATAILYPLGGYDNLLQALIMFVVIDYATGIIKAVKKQELNSYIGFKGIAKKVGLFCVVVMSHQLDVLMSQHVLRTVTIAFYIGNEGISILENLTELGVPIPKQIKQALKNFHKEAEK
jgi:toxin secretion/phage lysis holin